MPKTRNNKEHSGRHAVSEWQRLRGAWLSLIIQVAVIAAIAAVVLTQVLLFIQMPGLDMYPTLRDGDLLMAYRLERDYQKGDVVVYEQDGVTRVGRIMGRQTDVIEISEDGTLRVNGTVQDTDILFPTYYGDEQERFTYTVPEGSYYILGDYRTVAEDSRTYGAIASEDIQGKVLTVLRRRSI